MTDKDTARARITDLVEKWRNTSDTVRKGYNENQIRHYFILPLFRALGWDTEDPDEFFPEEQISKGFVDFGFYLNGIPRFYLETKKAAEKLEKPQNMQQAISYSYLKGVTWAVLTDFSQLMVFNAEWKERNPYELRFLNISWEHYATDRFDDLWLLSKPAMQAHEMDLKAENYGKKIKREPVTSVLFKQLTGWRHELFSEMRNYSRTLWAQNPQAVDNAVQKLLDRLIFIRTVEDREIEPNRLQALLRQSSEKELFANLLILFRELDGVYNSNLFALSEVDNMEVHSIYLLDDIITGLYREPGNFLSSQFYIAYNFNAISADILGAVYEQYLGFKVQDPQGKESLDPRKQEKRKKQGIYYTPQLVVRHIVRQTLGKILESGADPHKLRILDPACGSGSFLIEAFDVLDRWMAQNGTEEDKKFERRRRLRILQENLFGVDLDDQAVEVTRLNLLLRAASERNKLPLLTHIQHGNSLIDDPNVAGDTAFKWEERFPEVMNAGGFDVVIGNPPYGAAIPQEHSDYFRGNGNYKTASTLLDTYVLFMEKALKLLQSGGLFGMIVPSAWVSGPATTQLRKVFVSQFKPTAFASMPYDVFESAYIDTIVVAGERLPPGKSLHDFESAPVELVVFPPKHRIQSSQDFDAYLKRSDAVKWLTNQDYEFLVTASEVERELLAKVKKFNGKFSDVADIQRGVTPFELSESPPVINAAKAFTGTVRRYS